MDSPLIGKIKMGEFIYGMFFSLNFVGSKKYCIYYI